MVLAVDFFSFDVTLDAFDDEVPDQPTTTGP